MKFRYIFAAFAAVMTLAVACQKEPSYVLDSLQVDKSYITIAPEGGAAEITLTATEAWTFDFDVDADADSLDVKKGVVKYKVPVPQMEAKANNWVSITPSSGAAGTFKVKFSAEETSASRTTSIRVKVGENTYQNIIVAQTAEAAEVEESKCEEVLAGPDSKTYRVTGTVTKITETATYGNFYINDGTGEVYIYGTKYQGQTKQAALEKLGIAVGDDVTVEGPKTTYNGTVELVDVDVINVEKALLLSDDVNKTIGKEAADFTLVVSQKGEGITFDDSACDWVSFNNGYSVDKNGKYVFTLTALENATGASRTGQVTITSTAKDAKTGEEKKTAMNFQITQLWGDTMANASCADVAAACSGSTNSKAPVYFDVTLTDAVVTYKTGSNFFIEDEKGSILLYSSASTLAVGDKITGRVWGCGYMYNNLPEATQFNVELATVEHAKKAPEPAEITFAELAANFNKYVSRYVKVKGATVGTAIDVTYDKVTSAGTLSDGTNSLAFNFNKSGSYGTNPETGKANNIYWYYQFAEGAKVDVVCIPTIYKTNNQLGIWEKAWITEAK